MLSITLIILLVTVLISYQAFSNMEVFHKLSHRPVLEERSGQYYRLLTSGFIHANWPHLLINMFVFWQFGEIVERYYIQLFGELPGRLAYISLYIVTIVAANVPTYFKHRQNPLFSSVGASGAVSGVVFAFILFDPWAMLGLFFIIPCPAILAGILFLAYSQYASRRMDDRIDHVAHFYGAVFGFLFTLALKWQLFPYFLQEVVNGLPF